MKRKLFFTILNLAFVATLSAQTHKTIMVTRHQAIVDALASVKSSCQSIRALVDSSWPADAKAQMTILYTKAKKSSDVLISDYTDIIPQWRFAMNHHLDVMKQLKELQKNDSIMVSFFETNYLKYNGKAGLAITTEIIDLIFTGASKAYQFVKGIDSATKSLYISQINDQKMGIQFNGIKDNSSDSSSPTGDNRESIDTSGSKKNSNGRTTASKNHSKG